jgi:6-phosphogluconolactonase
MIKDIADLGSYISTLASSSISSHGHFSLAISGGSLPLLLSQALSTNPPSSPWHIWYVDERLVPLTHPDSNHFAASTHLYPIKGARVESVKTELCVGEAAVEYESRIKEVYGDNPRFDLVLLGLGPDGHTASLFPGHKLLEATSFVASISDSPKPPSERVTFTYPLINNAMVLTFG